jgi:cytoskeletal protein CcmA (bactofilin family)
VDSTNNVNEVSRISAGTVLKGDISSQNDIRIDGTFEGKIFSKGRVVMGDKAVISGDIICDNIDLWGRMTGSLYAKDTLTLKEGCIIKGDLHVKRLVVELGAKFDGNCKMLQDGEFDKLAASVAGKSSTGAAAAAAVPGSSAAPQQDAKEQPHKPLMGTVVNLGQPKK